MHRRVTIPDKDETVSALKHEKKTVRILQDEGKTDGAMH